MRVAPEHAMDVFGLGAQDEPPNSRPCAERATLDRGCTMRRLRRAHLHASSGLLALLLTASVPSPAHSGAPAPSRTVGVSRSVRERAAARSSVSPSAARGVRSGGSDEPQAPPEPASGP